MGYEKLLRMGYEKFLGMGYNKFLGMNYKKYLRIGSNIFLENNHKKSPAPAKPLPLYGVYLRNFSMENLSLEILWKIVIFTEFSNKRFLGISAKLLPGQ